MMTRYGLFTIFTCSCPKWTIGLRADSSLEKSSDLTLELSLANISNSLVMSNLKLYPCLHRDFLILYLIMQLRLDPTICSSLVVASTWSQEDWTCL